MTEEKKIKKRKISRSNDASENVGNSLKREKIVAESNVAADSPDDKTAIRINKNFVQQFRNKILSNGSLINELRDFVNAAEKNSAAIAMYLNSGGNPVEIVQLMKQIDKTSSNTLLVFDALRLLLIEILTKDLSKYINIGIQACKYLINNHISAFNEILAENNTRSIISVIKLLTAIITIDCTFGEDILKKIDFFVNENTMLESINRGKEQFKRNTNEVGTTCIYFFLSFLIDGNPHIVKLIAKRPHILEAVCFNLAVQDHTNINFLLQNITKHVLLSTSINREQKLAMFTDNTIRSIAMIYDNQSGHEENGSLNSEHREIAMNTAHEFLLLLLTSKKYGIVYPQDNYRQKYLLKWLKYPWMHDKKIDLYLKIVVVCPDLIKTVLDKIAFGLKPRNDPEFFRCVNFAKKFITTFDPKKLISKFEKLNMKELTLLLTDLCLSTTFLQPFKQGEIVHVFAEVKKEIVHLLYLMLVQLNKYFYEIKQSKKFKEYAIKRIKFEMLNQVLAFFPSFDFILNVLHKSIQVDAVADSLIKELLENTLDLLLIILNVYPILIEKSANVINYLNMLQPIYEFHTNDYDEQNINISLKAIKVILKLEPQILTKNLDIYEHMLKTFINIYVCGSKEKSLEAKVLLKNILQNTGIFEHHNEIDFWLLSFKLIESSTKLTSTIAYFTTFLRKTQEKGLKVQNSKYIENQLKDVYFMEIQTIDDLFANNKNAASDSFAIQIPLLNNFLPSVLAHYRKNKDEDSLAYLESVAVYLFHYLPYPKVVQQLFEQIEDSSVNTYFAKWLDDSKPTSLKKYDKTINSAFSKCYFKNKTNFFDGYMTLASEDTKKIGLVFKLNEQDVYLNDLLEDEVQIESLIHMTFFYASQLISMQQFSDEYYTTTIYYVKSFLSILQQIEQSQAAAFAEIDYENHDVKSNDIIINILNYIYGSLNTIYQNFILFDTTSNSTKLVVELTKFIVEQKMFHNTTNFKNMYSNKIVKQLTTELIGDNVSDANITELFQIIEIFEFDESNCLELLNYLVKLPGDTFLMKSKENNLHYELMVYVLQRYATFADKMIPKDVLDKVVKIYIHINGLITEDNMNTVNFDKLESSLYDYFRVNYYQIPNVAMSLFTCILEVQRKITKPLIKLAVLILDRTDNTLIEQFLLKLPKNVSKKELIFPLLNVAIQNEKFYDAFNKDRVLMNAVYSEYRNGILKTIDKPQKAGVIYKENLIISRKLISLCMPMNECLDFCKRNLKTDGMEMNQLALIETIFMMAFEYSQQNIEQQKLIYINFFQIFIQLFNLIVKKDNLDMLKIKGLIYTISKWIDLQNRREHLANLNFEQIYKSANWNIFAKNCLKYGMKLQLNTKTNKLDHDFGLLLKILAKLCDIFYANNCKLDDPALFFDMALSHSSCFDIILMKFNNEIKTNLFYLLNILVRKTAVVMDSKHIPLYLSGYGATLSVTDRYILSLIQYYELSGISLYEYRPFLWGEAAIKYYNQKEETTAESTAKLNEMNINDVIYLINSSRMNLTLNNFPVLRQLNTTTQLPNVCFDNLKNFGELENVSQFSIVRNKIERVVENDLDTSDDHLINICWKNDDLNDKLYDPAFFIPLIGLILAPETLLTSGTIVRTGCISLLFAALSNYDEEMRLVAGYNLQLCRQYIEASSIMDKEVWSFLFDVTQNGLDVWKKSAPGPPKVTRRIPFASALFLGHAVNILPFGAHDLYRPLVNYIMLRPSFNFNCIPEFISSFFSTSSNYIQEREFILGLLNNSLKTQEDYALLNMSPIMKTLLIFYDMPTSNRVANLQILSVINSIARIPTANYNMVQSHMLLIWLNSCIDKLEGFEFDTIDGFINIINNIWYSAKLMYLSYQDNYDRVNYKILILLLKLLPKLSPKHVSLKSLSRFVNILYKTTLNSNMKKVPKTSISAFLTLLDEIFPEYMQDIHYMHKHGNKCSENRQAYELKLINEYEVNNEVGFILSMSREFVKNWLKKQ